jgi:hypothetical protein
MDRNRIIKLYKEGYSLEYIINQLYYERKRENKIINLEMKKIILITNDYTKKNAKEEVYKIIYEFVKNKA